MRNIILIFTLLLYGCGFTPLYSNKNLNEFIFKEIEIRGERDINRSLISSVSFKEDKQNFLFEKLILKNDKSIIETSKNSKGIPESYRMTINFQIIIIDKGKIIKEKGFSEEFSYKNLDNKTDLYEYEINVQNNLIKKITEELIIYLNI